MKQKGYSLIELLVVVAIIGLLATLGTYAWQSSGKRSRDSVRKSDLSRIENALQQHYLNERSYPEYDSAAVTDGVVYAAGWQLANNTGCAHGVDKADFLTPEYLSEIPQDPRRSTSFTNGSCPELTDQHSHYLYLAGPADKNSPREFILMATLEASQGDRIPNSQNPVSNEYEALDNFADYSVGLGEAPNYFDANYLIRGGNGR